MGTSACYLAAIVAIFLAVGAGRAEKNVTEAVPAVIPPIDTCPCLPAVVCPHIYGTNPEDEKYFGTILKCEKPEDVRCCGITTSTSVVTSKSILPVNLPEEYQVRTTTSRFVTVLPETSTNAEAITTTESEIPTTVGMTQATTTATSLHLNEKHHGHAEARSSHFTEAEIEHMKKRLRDMLMHQHTDLTFEESRFRKTYQSTEVPTTTATTRRGRYSNKSSSIATLATESPRPLVERIPNRSRYDTRNRQNFLKISRTTTRQTPLANDEEDEDEDEKDEEIAENDFDQQNVEFVTEESVKDTHLAVAPEEFAKQYPTTTERFPRTRGRMRYGMKESTTRVTSTPFTTRARITRTSRTTSVPTPTKSLAEARRLPRKKMTPYTKTSTTTISTESTKVEEMEMAILTDISNQIKENRALEATVTEKSDKFQESPLVDFYFEEDDKNVAATSSSTITDHGKRLTQPILENGFLPMAFN